MMNLLYHSHTAVPSHLVEFETLGVLEEDEQVLVALDGVLLDGNGRRLSGPTLHDYCLITSLRVILWARDYGTQSCFAFPLNELGRVDGAGIDPIHAQLHFVFDAPEEDEQRFTLNLLPRTSLEAALTLLRTASATAQSLFESGGGAYDAAADVMTALAEKIYGHVDGLQPDDTPYRYQNGTAEYEPITYAPAPAFQIDPAAVPPGQIYTAGRLARSAWDTMRRTLREAELPFDLNSGSLRDLTEAVRAINELVHTMGDNPAAQQMAMAFLSRQGQGMGGGIAEHFARSAAPSEPPPDDAQSSAKAESAAAASVYHEIPLRRRESAPADPPPSPAEPVDKPEPADTDASSGFAVPDRREIPLRRRPKSSTSTTTSFGRAIAPMSGSGDAESE
jgi:hypothetical protein